MSEEGLRNLRRLRNTRVLPCGELVPIIKGLREIAGAQMSCFKLSGAEYPLLPRSAFYDYLYVSALCQPQNSSLAEGLMQFRVFTDIMFNPGTGKIKKFNTRARSCAIFVSLSKRGMLSKDIPSFEEFVATASYGGKQEAPAIKQQTLFG